MLLESQCLVKTDRFALRIHLGGTVMSSTDKTVNELRGLVEMLIN